MGNAVKGFLICYLIGVLAGSLPMVVLGGVVGLLMAFGYGFILGVPGLVVLIAIYAIWQPRIHANPTRWCIWIPFVAAVVFGLTFWLAYPPRDPFDLLSNGLWLVLLLPFIGGTVSALVFRSWLIGGETQQPPLGA